MWSPRAHPSLRGLSSVFSRPSHPFNQLVTEDKSQGRAIGILIADGSDRAMVRKIKKAAADAGASDKIIAPKVGGAKLADGSLLSRKSHCASSSLQVNIPYGKCY